ncbi:C40 family peptidase [Flavobacteriales bacterium]|nr:C40 family peptidase [Flavobacteriales bacterium]
MGKNISILIAVFAISFTKVSAQDSKLDKLEMYFDQGHYRLTLRKSKKLLRDSTYKNHPLPYMWKALSTAGIGIKKSKSLTNRLIESTAYFQTFSQFEKAGYYQQTYRAEILNYQEIFLNQIAEIKPKKSKLAKELFFVYQGTFEDPIVFETIELLQSPETINTSSKISSKKLRNKVVSEAKNHLGVPYKWGGTTKKGFDCSGYTSYVMAKNGISIPRIAKDQSKIVTKVNTKKVQPGDLIFFGNGTKVTHVGIIVSRPGENLSMIHASSSKGIMISNVTSSSYWKKRMLFMGSVIE